MFRNRRDEESRLCSQRCEQAESCKESTVDRKHQSKAITSMHHPIMEDDNETDSPVKPCERIRSGHANIKNSYFYGAQNNEVSQFQRNQEE